MRISLLLLFCPFFTAAQSNTEVYLFDVTPSENTITLTNQRNISNNLNTEVITLPASFLRTFTARHENLIYITGLRYNGIGQAFTNYLTVFNTVDNSFQEIDITGILIDTMTIREITISDSHIYFAIQTPGADNSFGISIMEAALN